MGSSLASEVSDKEAIIMKVVIEVRKNEMAHPMRYENDRRSEQYLYTPRAWTIEGGLVVENVCEKVGK